jgi:hypothetical protein
LVGVSATTACSPFDASLVLRSRTRPSAARWATPCRHRGRRTAGSPTGARTSQTFWVALRDVKLDQRRTNEWANIGYNIDGRCTDVNNAATATECVPVEGRSHEVDGNLGIDNSFGHNLFPLLDLAFDGLDERAIEAELWGLGNPLIRIRGWNGTPNDSRVQMLLTQSVFATPSNAGAQPDIHVIGSAAFLDEAGTMPAPLPIWDGTDYFWGRDDTFAVPSASPDLDAATPLVVDNNAYVANGILVTTVPDGTEIILVGDGLGTRVRLSGMIATANIAELKLEDAESITVTIAGRWGFNDLLRTAESVGVCPGSGQFNILRGQVASISDVLLDPIPNNVGTQCDAVSLGITFEAYPANVGGLALGQDLPNPCEDALTRPRRSSCARPGQGGGTSFSGSAAPE